MKTYCFDLDGTLCETNGSDYNNSRPKGDRIEQVNQLLINGNRIIIFTARGSTSGLDWRELTENQLEEWGIRHHQVIFGKPSADYYVDDKAIHDEVFFSKSFFH